jgi:hypothetical protein
MSVLPVLSVHSDAGMEEGDPGALLLQDAGSTGLCLSQQPGRY